MRALVSMSILVLVLLTSTAFATENLLQDGNFATGPAPPWTDTEALQWFKKAADQGDAKAQLMMGNAYLKGRGTICDDVEAVKWYQRAADQGSAEGQFGLAMEYHFGHGVIQNDAEAYFWISLSAQGNNSAIPVLELVRKKLTVQQLEDVRARVKQWKTKREL
jgi:Sel1 repeat